MGLCPIKIIHIKMPSPYETYVNFKRALQMMDVEKIKSFINDNESLIDTEVNEEPGILYAARQNRWDVVEIFYDAGANLDACRPNQSDYLVFDCIYKAPDNVTKAILEYCNVNVQDHEGKTPLMLAIELERKEVVDFILENTSPRLMTTDKAGNSAAHYAAQKGMEDVLAELGRLSRERILGIKNNNGDLPLDLFVPSASLAKAERAKYEQNRKSQETQNVTQNIIAPSAKGLSPIKRKF